MIGVAGAGLLFGSVGLLTAFATAPFAGADEAQHTAYALEVAAGRLPELDTAVRAAVPGMPGLPAGCRVPPVEARAAIDLRDVAILPGCARRPGGLSNFDLVYTANHPPLFYLLEAVPLGGGRAAGHPLAGFYGARLLNLAIGVAALVATAALARVLLPARPDLAVAATAFTAVISGFVAVAAQVYNDALAVALITAATAATLTLARRGPSARTLLPVLLLIPAAALSRASGALAAAVLVPAVGAAFALGRAARRVPDLGVPDRAAPARARVEWARDLLLGTAAAAGTAVLTVLAAGWFYLRNIRLYGDPTATGRIADMFPTGAEPRSAREVITSGDFWWFVYRGFFGRQVLLTGAARWVAGCVGLVMVVGLLAAAVRAAGNLRRTTVVSPPGDSPPGDSPRGHVTSDGGTSDGGTSDSRTPDGGMSDDGTSDGVGPATRRRVRRSTAVGVLCWLVAIAQAAVAVATLVGFVAAGGAPFTRYLLPALPLLAVALAGACSALPAARGGLPTSALVTALGITVVVMLGRELARRDPRLAGRNVLGRLHDALAVTAVGSDGALVLLGVLAVLGALGVSLVGLSLVMLGAAEPGNGEKRPARVRADRRPEGARPVEDPDPVPQVGDYSR
ncbi:hypothetical protein [Parafrankia discariae]|uniref:hypothetical protein n=1 Tax=Parafrankia discariae TaxID=365528 RepID=UPI0012B6A665|nr:hypothetical protein [Parafrankia discariae]